MKKTVIISIIVIIFISCGASHTQTDFFQNNSKTTDTNIIDLTPPNKSNSIPFQQLLPHKSTPPK